MEIKKRLQELVSTDKTPEENVICQTAMNFLLSGKAAGKKDLKNSSGFTSEKTNEIVQGLINRGFLVIDPENCEIVGSWGLSLVPTEHKIHIAGRDLFTWCALDAVGIPAGLGLDASIVSNCHHCNQEVAVEMKSGKIDNFNPPGLNIWLTNCQTSQSMAGYT